MAMGLVQGSSGIPFLSHPVYEYLSGKDILSITVTMLDVPLYEVRELLDQVTLLILFVFYNYYHE